MTKPRVVSPWKHLLLGLAASRTRNLMSWTAIHCTAKKTRDKSSIDYWRTQKEQDAWLLRDLLKRATDLGVAENLKFTMRATVADVRREQRTSPTA